MIRWLLTCGIRRFVEEQYYNNLKLLDGIDKSIRKAIGHKTGFLTALLAFYLALAGIVAVLEAGPIHRVAIFDFDKREVTPDPLARYIEQKLRQRFKAIEVVHYSGLGDELHSVRLLRGIEADGYDLVITRTSDALIIARHTLFKTPTLYTNVNNPLLLGFKTTGPPGGNISGASYYIPIEKHLQIYKSVFPKMKRPGFLFDKHNKSYKAEVPETRKACSTLGLGFEIEFVGNCKRPPEI